MPRRPLPTPQMIKTSPSTCVLLWYILSDSGTEPHGMMGKPPRFPLFRMAVDANVEWPHFASHR